MKHFLFLAFSILLTNYNVIISQPFTDVVFADSLVEVSGIAKWGDYDNDSDLDLFLAGSSVDGPVFNIYKNEGDDNFVKQDFNVLIGIKDRASIDLGDYNNDGFIDIVASGNDGSFDRTLVYKNKNGEGFVLQTSFNLQGVAHSSVEWGDYDNDGDLDILLLGNHFAAIYTNYSGLTFTKENFNFTQWLNYGAAAWGDLDNDNDLDVILTGYNGAFPFSYIYENKGDGLGFVENKQSKLKGCENGSISLGDYNYDGNLDVLMSGHIGGSKHNTIVYRNTGGFSLYESILPAVLGAGNSSIKWGDYDNDGDLDFFLAGYISSDEPKSANLYRNDGGDLFSLPQIDSLNFEDVSGGSVEWGDYDNDGDLDILLVGLNDSSFVTKIYRNNSTKPNIRPSIPTNLSYSIENNKAVLNWDKSTDNETGNSGLSYNVKITSQTSSMDVVSAMSDISTGFRKIVKIGNASLNNKYAINLPLGEYFWSVQAIDNSSGYSSFSEMSSITISADNTTGGSLTVYSPNGGEVWDAGSLQEIRWYSSELTAPVLLLYSMDGGSSWIEFYGASSTTESSYIWDVPNTPSNNCFIKIKNAVDSATVDVSDIAFTISNPTDIDDKNKIINKFSLFQNYPNPFNPSTIIKYSIPSVKEKQMLSVKLKVYDVLGNEILTLVDEEKRSGNYQETFNASSLSNGVYYYQIKVYVSEKSNIFFDTKKMIFLK